MTITPTSLTLTKERKRHERQLIGRAITCIPSALAVADILTASNFRDELCQRVFQIILEGVDTMELDLMSITRKYNQRYEEKKSYEITMLVEHADLSSYVMNEAILLLETDIREKFCALLSRMEQEQVKAEEFEAAAIWKQCHDYMAHPGNDPLKSVEHLYSYLKANFPDEVDEYNQLRIAMPKLADRIRTRAKTRKFLDTLTTLGADAVTHDKRMSIKILSDWMIICMSSGELPENFYTTLNQLNSTWNV